ncbi:MAG: hypothetical protein ACLQGP_22840 [Isosphaeraceae bacterium]
MKTTDRVRTLWVLAMCGLSTSCIRIISHDESKAANTAAEFARAAFVARDYPRAYGLLASSARSQVTLQKLTESIAEMHPKGFPSQVDAAEYEPMPGQRAMNIYLNGTGEGEAYFYRLLMEGDAPSGYGVIGLYRSNGPPPPSNRKPLPK